MPWAEGVGRARRGRARAFGVGRSDGRTEGQETRTDKPVQETRGENSTTSAEQIPKARNARRVCLGALPLRNQCGGGIYRTKPESTSAARMAGDRQVLPQQAIAYGSGSYGNEAAQSPSIRLRSAGRCRNSRSPFVVARPRSGRTHDLDALSAKSVCLSMTLPGGKHTHAVVLNHRQRHQAIADQHLAATHRGGARVSDPSPGI